MGLVGGRRKKFARRYIRDEIREIFQDRTTDDGVAATLGIHRITNGNCGEGEERGEDENRSYAVYEGR